MATMMTIAGTFTIAPVVDHVRVTASYANGVEVSCLGRWISKSASKLIR